MQIFFIYQIVKKTNISKTSKNGAQKRLSVAKKFELPRPQKSNLEKTKNTIKKISL